MDPLSIIGTIDVAVSGIVGLSNLINSIKAADEELRSIDSNLKALTTLLTTLAEISTSDTTSPTAKNDLKKVRLADAVRICDRTCGDFRKVLNKLVKNSNGRLPPMAQWSAGVFKKAQIRSLKEQTRSCQDTVQLTLTTAQL